MEISFDWSSLACVTNPPLLSSHCTTQRWLYDAHSSLALFITLKLKLNNQVGTDRSEQIPIMQNWQNFVVIWKKVPRDYLLALQSWVTLVGILMFYWNLGEQEGVLYLLFIKKVEKSRWVIIHLIKVAFYSLCYPAALKWNIVVLWFYNGFRLILEVFQ